MLPPHKTSKKSISLLTSNRNRNICSKWALPSLIFDVMFADYLILLAASADIQCNIAFIVSFITSAVVTGNGNTPGLKEKNLIIRVIDSRSCSLSCIVGVVDIKMLGFFIFLVRDRKGCQVFCCPDLFVSRPSNKSFVWSNFPPLISFNIRCVAD